MRANLILVVVGMLCLVQTLDAQSPNPFELLWRTNKGGTTSTPKTTPIAEVSPKAETLHTITPVAPPPAPVITPPVPDTMRDFVIKDTLKPVIVEEVVDTIPVRDSAQIAAVTPAEEETQKKDVLAVSPVKKPIPPQEGTPLSLVLLFGVIFSLLAWGMSLNRALLQKIYRAALNENLSALLYREQRFATTQYLYYTIYVIFFLNGGMFLYFLSRQFGWTDWIFQSLWTCIGLVVVVYLLRHLSLSILGSTYPVTKETTHFSFSILLHNILLGIGLIPINLLLAFGPDGMHQTTTVIGLILCGLVYLMRQFRGFLISSSLLGSNPFRFFIYLCAVEILPLFTLVKFFHN